MEKNRFEVLWDECSREQKIQMFKDYCSNYGCDDEVFDFDEEFFEIFFSDRPMEAARACVFGDVTWCDPYIKFDGYGNLESLNEYAVEDLCDEYMDQIYDHEDIWKDYIQEEYWRECAEDFLSECFEYEINVGAVDLFIEDHWSEEKGDMENVGAFRKWYKENFSDDKCKLGLDQDAYDNIEGSITEDVDSDIITRFVNEYWDYDISTDDNVRAFAEWYENLTGEKITVIE